MQTPDLMPLRINGRKEGPARAGSSTWTTGPKLRVRACVPQATWRPRYPSRETDQCDTCTSASSTDRSTSTRALG